VYWKSAGLYVWLSQNGWVRGIIALEALTEDEVEAALSRRWPVTLSPINTTDLRGNLYEAVRPHVIWSDGEDQSRYQYRKLTIWPRREPVLTEPSLGLRENNFIEPMPILI
jgi:hypothetical protein